ncbi:hypothetical protein PPL_08299 [Heterostelium album PN500]|uniref:Uncharacterized protein n=1 Tax=Heterostelium pallidum (strain ATCC 26659 / Pp 5 / PN500) TaxID=670386 RepID=D3BHT5_HETP5|nr:hypothetical protein PPL_08299 [Heterostelium album PN500]EFA78835.1 hypothetical protein PPL_08299 [Heterostelium album PN500]|eukprot:XP_020430959.1 hypothetical protein PPL_08299 [Heterostelium album PN500]
MRHMESFDYKLIISKDGKWQIDKDGETMLYNHDGSPTITNTISAHLKNKVSCRKRVHRAHCILMPRDETTMYNTKTQHGSEGDTQRYAEYLTSQEQSTSLTPLRSQYDDNNDDDNEANDYDAVVKVETSDVSENSDKEQINVQDDEEKSPIIRKKVITPTKAYKKSLRRFSGDHEVPKLQFEQTTTKKSSKKSTKQEKSTTTIYLYINHRNKVLTLLNIQ